MFSQQSALSSAATLMTPPTLPLGLDRIFLLALAFLRNGVPLLHSLAFDGPATLAYISSTAADGTRSVADRCGKSVRRLIVETFLDPPGVSETTSTFPFAASSSTF